MEYELIRSGRRSFGIQVKSGMVIVRAPMKASQAQIEEVLQRYKPFAEWYGTLTATCDYFVRDPSTEERCCCYGG